MNVYTKSIMAIALFLGAASSVQASNPLPNKEGAHPPPSFESIDTNTDGEVDFDEFSSHKLPNDDHKTVFNLIDTDNNGVISQDEFDNHKPPSPKHVKGSHHD
ncbi:EF-hand domain-containing protein [Colwellia sp. MB02u-10]|jgi:Ca2+-binding EF-hand superfamily protein|uniref:EF-hand domain-containing protein n=1 Tax=Colwellia sp. MB02u-10 TaxID=2759828 RepID=UPI0015F45364|nr:EF-hand domain-containing protein [Colwellia sp. MB02u-10]MBA6339975.1 EF-hand domain-containing protein [Colwellia sp. MB02u-10]